MSSYIPQPSPKPIRLFYFWSGIVATLAYRIIVILNNYSPVWVMIAWYIGTIGFIIYFLHRYQVSEKRAKLIEEHQLVAKINKSDCLTDEDKEVAGYIFKTLKSTKEKWNYIFIFIMSAVALVIGIYLDFIK